MDGSLLGISDEKRAERRMLNFGGESKEGCTCFLNADNGARNIIFRCPYCEPLLWLILYAGVTVD